MDKYCDKCGKKLGILDGVPKQNLILCEECAREVRVEEKQSGKFQIEEARRKKQMQNSMIGSIVLMIVALSVFAAIVPAWNIDGTFDANKVQIQWAFFGLIAAFMIFLVFSRGASINKIRCTNCNRYIPSDSNLCPYCGKTIFREEK